MGVATHLLDAVGLGDKTDEPKSTSMLDCKAMVYAGESLCNPRAVEHVRNASLI